MVFTDQLSGSDNVMNNGSKRLRTASNETEFMYISPPI